MSRAPFLPLAFALALLASALASGSPLRAEPAASPAAPPAPAPAPATEPLPVPPPPSGPGAVVWQVGVEPREAAFRFLVPLGWQVEGGIFRVNPLEAGGVGNSLSAKCDLTFRRDPAGTVSVRLMPTWYHAAPLPGTLPAILVPQGGVQNGMPVKPLPAVQDFLDGLLAGSRPAATGVAVVERRPLPDLAARLAPRYEAANRALSAAGIPPARLDAGGLVATYVEGGVAYRETLLAVLLDQRATFSCWSNELTISWRAPQDEADAWEPVFRRLLESIQVNALWWARESAASFERSRIVVDTAQEIRRLDQEIWENRQRTNERIQRQFSDYLTGQQRYLDPYDLEVVTDWASADYRWVTSTGEVIYTDDSLYDPNSDSRVWNRTWERSPEIGR